MRSIKFGPLEVAYDDRVLEPRRWTVVQAEWAAEIAAAGLPPGPLLELCAGAGHIGQAAARLTGRALVQVDVDSHACSLARANAQHNGLGSRVEVRCAEVTEGVRHGERFPMVLADPPYLASDDAGRDHGDPALAVDGGAEGLDVLRRCVAVAGACLVEGGVILVQARGRSQVEALAPDITACGLAVVEVREVDEVRAVARLEPVGS